MKVKNYRKPLLVIIAALASACLFCGCFLLPQEEELLSFELLRPMEVEFTTIQVQRGSIQNILRDHCVATSAILYEMSFHSRSGFLAELNVQSGDEVKQGDILAKLDTGSLEADIQRHKLYMEKIEISLTQARRSGSRDVVRHAELDLQIALITLSQLEDEYEKATIIAPYDGEIVFLSNLRIGEWIPGHRHILTIADPARVQFVYTGQHSMLIRYGMEAEIIIDTDKYLPVKVSMTPHEVPLEELDRYRETVVFTAIDPDNIPQEVQLGRRYDFTVVLEEKSDVIVLPRSAVSTFMGQYYVQLLEDGMRVERDIVVGIMTNREVEVISGLEENETIITGTLR